MSDPNYDFKSHNLVELNFLMEKLYKIDSHLGGN
jgi:hypothetical protein